MCQSQQERGPCILVERLVVVSKMNIVNIFTGKLLGPSCSATSISASIAACHSGASCSVLGSLVM